VLFCQKTAWIYVARDALKSSQDHQKKHLVPGCLIPYQKTPLVDRWGLHIKTTHLKGPSPGGRKRYCNPFIHHELQLPFNALSFRISILRIQSLVNLHLLHLHWCRILQEGYSAGIVATVFPRNRWRLLISTRSSTWIRSVGISDNLYRDKELRTPLHRSSYLPHNILRRSASYLILSYLHYIQTYATSLHSIVCTSKTLNAAPRFDNSNSCRKSVPSILYYQGMNGVQTQPGASRTSSTAQDFNISTSDRTGLHNTTATTKYAMNAPTFVPSGQAFRQSNGVQQSFQSLSMTTMNAFTGDGGPNSSQQSGGAFTSGPCSVVIRRLPVNTTEDTLRLMVVWSKEFIDAEVMSPEKSEDSGFRSAILRFKSHAGALEAKNMLDGKPNVANDAQMMVEIYYGSPTSSRRYTVDNTSNPGPSSSTSSTASSTGQTTRQSSRFNGTFHTAQRVSPPNNGTYASNELPNPENSAHYQSLFSPQSPIGNHLNERTRITGKSLINNDSVDDDETGELLKDPVAYAENGSSSIQQRRPTNPQIPISRMAGLSLNTNNAAGPAPLSSFSATPQGLSSISHTNAMSPTSLSSSGPPVNYQLGSQHYQRHNFPPVNPADQNPPCNTLYVGNLPIDTSEDELKAMFSKQRGYKRLCFRTKQNGPMCFVEFEDVSFATKALHELYGHPLHNSIKGGIRLSFSKNPLGVRSGQGMASPGPPNLPGVMQGMNGVLLGGPGATFSTASGPPPGLAAPPGLGSNRMGYSNSMSGPSGQYTAASYTGNTNGWNGPIFAGAMSTGGPATMMNGTNNGFPPAYMMGR
jgi:hypothetical protein